MSRLHDALDAYDATAPGTTGSRLALRDVWSAVGPDLPTPDLAQRVRDLVPRWDRTVSVSDVADAATPASLPGHWSLVRGLYVDASYLDEWEAFRELCVREPEVAAGLTHLEFADGCHDEPGLAFVSAFPALTTLFLDGPTSVSDLAGLAALPELRWLNLYGANDTEGVDAFTVLDRLPALAALAMGRGFLNVNVWTQTWRPGAPLARRLTHLAVPDVWLAAQDPAALPALACAVLDLDEDWEELSGELRGLLAALGEQSLREVVVQLPDRRSSAGELLDEVRRVLALLPDGMGARLPARYDWTWPWACDLDARTLAAVPGRDDVLAVHQVGLGPRFFETRYAQVYASLDALG
jgi:hypothetical protein